MKDSQKHKIVNCCVCTFCVVYEYLFFLVIKSSHYEVINLLINTMYIFFYFSSLLYAIEYVLSTETIIIQGSDIMALMEIKIFLYLSRFPVLSMKHQIKL